ncbi:hypothetical protein CYMTET_7103 [Cymbomonas tetramitiformis]|uniref:Uncharacterized protein n=1 Tax=Cymbomonas tetramitiformis TaxID=36881 RepID=A0AAE0GWA3_9CHLO|nr:hypothetical protein CYMTET_7103 [Cymbomonas tetramitiformis]
MGAQDESAMSLSSNETCYDWKDASCVVHRVPEDILEALKEPFRGQSNFGPQHKFLLSLFNDVPEYHQTLHPKKTCAQNVRSTLVCKYDESVKTNVAFYKISSGKLLNKVLYCKNVPDEAKLRLTEKCTAAEGKKWRATYEKKRKEMEASDFAGLAAAEQEVVEEVDPSATKRRERQAVLKDYGMQVCTEAQATALNFLLGCFFFACKIPFAVVNNVFFRAFIHALSPGYAKRLPGRAHLSASILDDVYEETLVSTDAALDRAPGKRTLGLDGKTNCVGRATCNIGEAKLGICAYVTTKYFGKREHSGRIQATYAYEEIKGREDKFQAVVADNTGNKQVILCAMAQRSRLHRCSCCCVLIG